MAFDPSLIDLVDAEESVVITVDGRATENIGNALVVSANINAVSLFTTGIIPRRLPPYSGYMNISVSGTFEGSIVLQRSFDLGLSWHAVATYTAVTQTSLTDKEMGVVYRLGCPASWTSGTAVCRLSLGGIDGVIR